MRIATLFTGFLLTAMAASSAYASTVTIATEGGYPPFNFTEPSGKLGGFEIDLANDLCARAKLTCKFTTQTFAGMIPGLQAKKFDAVMDSIQITPQREKVVAFSTPYLAVPSTFAVEKKGPLSTLAINDTIYNLKTNDAAVVKEIAALKPLLKGKTIGVEAASVQARFVDTYLKGDANIREYQNITQAILDLNDGRIDAVFGQLVVLDNQLAKPQFTDLSLAGPRFTGGILGKGIGIAFRKNEGVLTRDFDKAIASMKADGSLSKLAVKWFHVDISPKP